MSKEIAEDYASSLADLNVNSKPLINMLTILAEENIEHAAAIVETVEKHLEKVQPEIKLPVLYLVDSIIKNVGGAYIQKFSQIIVNMFTRTFKQVDEKTRSQMFKLRETWHEVFPSTKLYQLDVKVNLIDPAWPIQAQPHQANIHVNPNFLKKPMATTSHPVANKTEEEEKMKSILAKKEQELLMLQRKKIEMELEQTRKQLEIAERNTKMGPVMGMGMPVAMVNPVMAMPPGHELAGVPVKQRLGPPVNKVACNRIAPVSAALVSARRDPRLARLQPAVAPPIAPNVFDIKPLERVTKRKNVITIDVAPDDRPRERRRDPRLEKRIEDKQKRERIRKENVRKEEERKREEKKTDDEKKVNAYVAALPDMKKLPPIPKINRDEAKDKDAPSPNKRRKDLARDKKKKRDSGSSNSSPEKKAKSKESSKKKEKRMAVEETPEQEVVAFKELKNYHKERYRRNKEKSESPETVEKQVDPPAEIESSNATETLETKDVDLRVLPGVAAAVGQKRPSTETLEGKTKKTKVDKFDILFGNEDVDLRQLPQVDETIKGSPKLEIPEETKTIESPPVSPKQKDWNEVKEKDEDLDKKVPSKLDLVRAKLAEATKGKDRLGRPLLFSKSPSVEKERRRTLSSASEDVDLRIDNPEDFDAEDHKKTISIIMSQAKEQFSGGQLDKNQYKTLMYQVLQLNEKLKLKEAKQRESLEISKAKLKAHIQENKVPGPITSPKQPNNFGDIDERVNPAAMLDTPPDSQGYMQDSDMRMPMEATPGLLPPPAMPPFMGPYNPTWRGQPRHRADGPRSRFRGPHPQKFYRGSFDRLPRPPFEKMMPMPSLPTPKLGMAQGESPLMRYERVQSPPPLGTPSILIPPTDFKVLDYIDQDPMKTIQIDGIPREIRFYGDTAVIMLDWDDPREIKFLPGCRRVTFDNKDSIVLNFDEPPRTVEIDDQVFDIRFGAPTRELYINGRWYEAFFGGQPFGVLIDGKPRLVQLEGPMPQVDIGKMKRTDLVAGKINLIINATHMCPVYLDSKVQKFEVNGHFFTIRFVDALRTILINEQPFKVEFGDLPRPIVLGNEKYFVRLSALPRQVKPGLVEIANMEGSKLSPVPKPVVPLEKIINNVMEVDEEERPANTPSPVGENQGLEMLASVMPPSVSTPSSATAYHSSAPSLGSSAIPGLGHSDQPPPTRGILGNINISDLFAKLVETGIVSQPKTEVKEKVEEVKEVKEERTVVLKVDLLKPETLRVKQPGLVSRLYGGMQCSGCGARFPPERTVRYSQHLDWHFRQNRRERDSARRAHSRHWHYDLSDWVQYEEVEDLEEREKSWFETGGAEEGEPIPEVPAETPSVAAGAPRDHHCALCGDKFDQFYNEDKEEWHLRNSVRHEDDNYHPMCFEDYKASQSKVETKEDPRASPQPAEAIEIPDADDAGSASDVELLEPDEAAAVEIDEGDEDDVVFKAEPLVQVDVPDADTDDELAGERRARDCRAELDFARVKVKQEPVDPDDEPIVTAEEEKIQAPAIESRATVLSSIDGNVQLEAAPVPTLLGGIRINISKTIPTVFTKDITDRASDELTDDEPLPPGEEPELEYKLKPNLEGVKFSRLPPVQKGNELSGLCSIM